ncbi:glycoside hydrolase family 48 protein, partial [Streptomyces fradiae]
MAYAVRGATGRTRTRPGPPCAGRGHRGAPPLTSRQVEFYRWLQSDEGAIAGGATNSWQGRYATP